MVISETKPSRLIKLYFQVEFYSMLCLLASKFIFHQPIILKSILYTLFPFTSGSYWFVSAYAVLIALVPLLNRFIKSMDRQQHFVTIVLLTVLFCIIPTFMFWSRDLLGNGYSFIWFIVLYITSAYIRLYSNEIPQKLKPIKYAMLYLVLSGVGIISILVIGTISRTVFGEVNGELLLIAYNSVIIFPASVCLFIVFKNINIKNEVVSKFILVLGSVCFGTYLLTDNPLISDCLWKEINLPKAKQFGILFQSGYILIIVLVLFALGCLIEKGRTIIIRAVKIDRLYKLVDNISKRLLLSLKRFN